MSATAVISVANRHRLGRARVWLESRGQSEEVLVVGAVARWTFGRVTLIGDAAHPMQPIGSQAGSQAIVDARVLAAALVASSDPIAGLQRYDAERRPVMDDVTLRNRDLGPEAGMQLVEERAPNGFTRIEDVISQGELDAIAKSSLRSEGAGGGDAGARATWAATGAAANIEDACRARAPHWRRQALHCGCGAEDAARRIGCYEARPLHC